MSEAERVVAGRTLLTPHPPQVYPGVLVIRPDGWPSALIIADAGQTVMAQGGEVVYAYRTADGGEAQGFELRPGDRATLLRLDLPFALAEWRIDRASHG